METKQPKKGKILPFEQDTDFFLRRGAKDLDKNDLLAAVQSYRKAYAGDPADLDSCLALSELLSRMMRFEESNRLLLVDISMNEPDPESYFGLAHNYFGMHEFRLAQENLETYLRLEPDGYYAYDAAEFLDVLCDEEALLQAAGAPPGETPATLTAAAYARRAAARGDLALARSLLTAPLADAPHALSARGLLAGFCLRAGDAERALELSREVLAVSPGDVAARCVELGALSASGRQQALDAGLDALAARLPEDEDALDALSQLQLSCGRYEEAGRTLQRLVQLTPYDAQRVHRYACCRFRLGDADGARACYRRLLSIDPDDTVARYYFNACGRRDGAARHWTAEYRVPPAEAFRRFRRLNALFEEPAAEFLRKWKENRGLRSLFVWALTLPDGKPKSVLLRRLAAIGDADAERILRDFALRTDQPDAAKREALLMLQYLGAKEPYCVYLSDRWISGYVNVRVRAPKLPADYQGLLGEMETGLAVSASPDAIFSAIRILRGYLDACGGKYPRISTNQQASFAAALELLGRRCAGETPDEAEIARRYRVSLLRLHNAVSKFEPFAKEP